ncbi:MAG: hypothetical protein F6K49_11870 [Moorea sp. SIO3I6]|nr:hypothetical protein [Moorena sp. SIO3I6]
MISLTGDVPKEPFPERFLKNPSHQSQFNSKGRFPPIEKTSFGELGVGWEGVPGELWAIA